MRRFLPLLVAVLLAGASSGVFAARYLWSSGFWTESASCYSLSLEIERIRETGHLGCQSEGWGASGDRVWWPSTVTGLARAPGDQCSIQFTCLDAAGQHTSTVTQTLNYVQDEDFLDDVTRIDARRIAVLVGCALMFGIGWVAGK